MGGVVPASTCQCKIRVPRDPRQMQRLSESWLRLLHCMHLTTFAYTEWCWGVRFEAYPGFLSDAESVQLQNLGRPSCRVFERGQR